MEKIPFNISASSQGQTAFIRITGTIGWDTDCELYRARIDAIAQQGLTDAHIYLNGPGGSVFDAEEIVNITKSVPAAKSGGARLPVYFLQQGQGAVLVLIKNS